MTSGAGGVSSVVVEVDDVYTGTLFVGADAEAKEFSSSSSGSAEFRTGTRLFGRSNPIAGLE